MPKKQTKNSKLAVSKANSALQPTGIDSLDKILRGGIPSGSTVLLAGSAGTGKTILALQWIFAGNKRYGEPGLFVSATEYLTGAIRRAQNLTFFDPSVVGLSSVYFTDVSELLRQVTKGSRAPTRKDVFALADAIFELAMKMGAKRIVIDSITSIGHRLNDFELVREFIFQLISKLSVIGANVILTSEVADGGYSTFKVEEFMADGIISLTQEPGRLYEPVRKLRVVKMRAAVYNANPVLFRISADGLTFFPREKGRLTYQVSNERIGAGVDGLDAMVGGGYFRGTSVLFSGSAGAGKTLFALQCVKAALEKGERCLFLSFEESREHLIHEGNTFGWNLEAYERQGTLRVVAAYPEEFHTDEHLHKIFGHIDELHPSVLVFDSASALHSVFSEIELHDMLSNLIAHVKTLGMTMIITGATTGFFGPGDLGTDVHLSTVADAIIALRQIEIQSEMRHALIVLKMRGSDHDRTLREFVFGPEGIRVISDFKGYENVLSGGARKVSESTEERLRELFRQVLGPLGGQMFEHERAAGLDFNRVKRLLAELGDQGIISQRRKEEFIQKSKTILGNA